MPKTKDKAAVALGKKRWKGKTPEEKSSHAQMMNEERWKEKSAEDRRRAASAAAKARWAKKTAILTIALLSGWGLALSLGRSAKAAEPDSGVLVLDKDGWASKPFAPGFLDSHFCTVADGWDEVTVGFSAKGFTISDGQPRQEVPWACVPD